jgi:hypothetical protein
VIKMAGIGHLDEFSKPSLRGLVDETEEQRVPTLADKYLPNAEVYSRTFAYDIIKNNTHIAAMIGYGAEAPIMDRDAVASMHGEIAKMGIKHVVTEEELLAIFEARNAGEKQNVVERLVVKGVELVEAIQRRINVIKMEAIMKGTFEHVNKGVKVSLDFGIPANHKIDLKGVNDNWLDVDKDVIGDLLDAVKIYEDTNGITPQDMLISREIMHRLQNNLMIVNESGRPDGAKRTSEAEVVDVLRSYGLPPITVVTDRKVNIKRMDQDAYETIEFMPHNRVVLVSQNVGEYLVGITVENGFRPGINLSVHDNDEPIMSYFKAVAAGFPAVEKPELIMHMDVLPAE